MATLADDLRKLAGLKRTKKNFEKIQEQVGELAQYATDADTALEALSGFREKLDELQEALGNTDTDNPLLEWAAAFGAELDGLTVPGGNDDSDIPSLIQEAETACEEYDSIRVDPEYDSLGRDETWGALCDALDNIANALDPKGATT